MRKIQTKSYNKIGEWVNEYGNIHNNFLTQVLRRNAEKKFGKKIINDMFKKKVYYDHPDRGRIKTTLFWSKWFQYEPQ